MTPNARRSWCCASRELRGLEQRRHAGIARVEVFLRPTGSAVGPGERVLLLETARDALTPHGR